MNLGRLDHRTGGQLDHRAGSKMTAPGAAACYIGDTRVLLADRNEPKTAPWERDRNVQFAALAWNHFDSLLNAVQEAMATGFFKCNCQAGTNHDKCNGSCTYSTLKDALDSVHCDIKEVRE